MPLFFQMIVYGVTIYILSIPFINLIDEYNEKKDREAEIKHGVQPEYDDFDFDWLEEIIEKENENA